MSASLAAAATYAATVTMIYSIGHKAEDFLSDEAIRKLRRFAQKDHPFSPGLELITSITMSVIDRGLRFKHKRNLVIPSVWRSVLFSLLMLALISYLLEPFYWEYGMAVGFALASPIAPIFLFNATFFVANIVADYFSFTKTRTLMGLLNFIRVPYREAMILFLDITLSILICAAVACPIAIIECQLAGLNLLRFIAERGDMIRLLGQSGFFLAILVLYLPIR